MTEEGKSPVNNRILFFWVERVLCYLFEDNRTTY